MKFIQRFSHVEIGESEAQQRFISRMLYVFFPSFPSSSVDEVPRACSALGETLTDPRNVEQILRENFLRLLDMLERLFATLPRDSGDPRTLTAPKLEQAIQHELGSADIDLGVEWRDGCFYPRGAKLLDNALVDDPLDWLINNGLPTVHDPLTKALSHFLHARKDSNLLADAITDAYDALEAMAKYVCGNERTFDHNRESFLSRIKASENFKKIAKEMSNYAHTFRHGTSESKPKPTPSVSEVEAFIYSVGILIRLAISANGVQNNSA